MSKERKNPKSFRNDIISSFKAAYYNTYEPLRLKWERFKHKNDYISEKNPMITVYTPTYNRGKLLIERAVPSVLSQTYKNFEYIIVGDCCTDNTTELVSNIKDDRIRYYNIPKRGYRYPPSAENNWLAGPVVASNKALEMAKGKWITRMDDDDTWTTDHLEGLINYAINGNYEFVSGLYETIRYGKKIIVDGELAQGPYYTRNNKPPKGDNPKIGGIQTWLYRSYLKFMKYNIDCWRKQWNRVNDIDISIRMFKAGVRMGFVDKVLAFVYPRPGDETVGLQAYLKLEEKGLQPHS